MAGKRVEYNDGAEISDMTAERRLGVVVLLPLVLELMMASSG